MKHAHDLLIEFLNKKNSVTKKPLYADAKAINNGGCGEFATKLIERISLDNSLKNKLKCKQPMWLSQLYHEYETERDQPTYAGHCVVMFNDKLYDAEHPNGVDHIDELEYIKRIPRK